MTNVALLAYNDIVKYLHETVECGEIQYHVDYRYLISKEQRRLNRDLKDQGYNLDNRQNNKKPSNLK